jgi:hypothetical protein
LYDLENDPTEMNNLARNISKNGDALVMMNDKLNRLIETEVGEDVGQMLPGKDGTSWTLSTSVADFRP